MNKLVLGLPKGSLQEATFSMMKKAGFTLRTGSRSYVPDIDDEFIDARLIRAQEISRYVESGTLDAGITGYDWIVENDSNITEVAELIYAKQGLRPVRWVVAVPNDSPIKSINDLNGKRISTEAVGLTNRFLKENNITAQVEFSWGATEVKTPELADAIVELTETGSSLRANNLKILDTVIESTTRFIANNDSWKDTWKRKKIEQVAMLLEGALRAENSVVIKLNCLKDNLDRIISVLPSLHAPTISYLNSKDWVAVETVLEEKVVRNIIPELKEYGAEGIIELPLNKVIP